MLAVQIGIWTDRSVLTQSTTRDAARGWVQNIGTRVYVHVAHCSCHCPRRLWLGILPSCVYV